MKKMVVACLCDVCGKQIDQNSDRYVFRMGVGNWNNEHVQLTYEKDLCRSCYDTVRDLLKSDIAGEKPRIGDDIDSDVAKPAVVIRRRKHDFDKIHELYCKGYSNTRISKELGIPLTSLGYHINKCKAMGAIRGEDNIPEYKEPAAGLRTVVDSRSGLVTVVE